MRSGSGVDELQVCKGSGAETESGEPEQWSTGVCGELLRTRVGMPQLTA